MAHQVLAPDEVPHPHHLEAAVCSVVEAQVSKAEVGVEEAFMQAEQMVRLTTFHMSCDCGYTSTN